MTAAIPQAADSGPACAVCGVTGVQWAVKNGVVLMRCRACGLLFVPRADTSRLDPTRAYASYHAHSAFAAPPSVQASLARLVSAAGSYRRTNRWLDMGFGEGDLLHGAERQGWQCFGTEVSPHALEHGQSRGWTVTTDPAQDSRFAPATFDVVTMIEVLEHVRDPRALVESAARWLRPGGFLYLTTPNARSLNRWVLGPEWSVVCPPEHLALWTAKAVRALLQDAGFPRIRIRTQGLNPVEIVARLRPGADPKRVHRQSAGVALSEALSRSRPRRALKKVANLLLDLLGVGDTLKVRAERMETDASVTHGGRAPGARAVSD
jgi:SAM-dependent methyltransferase